MGEAAALVQLWMDRKPRSVFSLMKVVLDFPLKRLPVLTLSRTSTVEVKVGQIIIVTRGEVEVKRCIHYFSQQRKESGCYI